MVETSGVADPEPIAAMLAASGLRLDCCVAVVDAEAAAEQLELPTARAQLAAADVVVLNKCDLVRLGVGGDAAAPDKTKFAQGL